MKPYWEYNKEHLIEKENEITQYEELCTNILREIKTTNTNLEATKEELQTTKEELQTTKEELQSEKNKVASLVKRVGDLENNVETLGKLLKEERDRFQVYVTRYSYQMMQTFKQEMEAHINRACVRISNMITHPPEYDE